jgi:hypothetical protein
MDDRERRRIAETTEAVMESHPTTGERRRAALDRKTKVLETPEHNDYRGHDTGWEYDKYIARHREDKGDTAFDNKEKIIDVDRKAYCALRSAGHDRQNTEKAIGERSLNSLGRSADEQRQYGSYVVRQTENQPEAVQAIDRNRQLRSRHGLAGDNRLQSTEIAQRREEITKQPNVYSAERVHDPKQVRSAEIYRSNYQSRQDRKLAESGTRRDTELAKTHVDDRPENIPAAGKVLASNSPNAANYYSPKKQEEYGQAVAAKAYLEQQQEQRPDPQRESLNHRYASSESHYHNTRQAYYQHHGLNDNSPTRSR